MEKYKTVEELFNDLRDIEPMDLTSGENRSVDVFCHLSQIMNCLVRGEDVLYEARKQGLSEELRKIGCTRYAYVNEKYTSSYIGSTRDAAKQLGNLAFPLTIITNLITSDVNFDYAYEMFIEGGENSLLGEWIETNKELFEGVMESRWKNRAYTSVDKMFSDLKKIKPVDFTREDTLKVHAVKFSKDVLECLIKGHKIASDVADRSGELAEILKNIGCVSSNKIAPKFASEDGALMEELAKKEGDVAFPLDIFSNLISGDSFSVNAVYNWFIMDGGEHSLARTWLDTQKNRIKE